MKLLTDNPNFTVLVPNECGCKCPFCFLRQDDIAATRMIPFSAWLQGLKAILARLPRQFANASVSGGEPTMLSPEQLYELLTVLRTRFSKVIVTTNGERFLELCGVLSLANHVNLSFHGLTPEESNVVFGRDVSPPLDAIRAVAAQLKALGATLRMQCVVTSPPTQDFVTNYVKMAIGCGATDVSIRYDARLSNGLDGSWIPYPLCLAVDSSTCPVCATWTYLASDGTPVHFKAGLVETQIGGAVFEVIYRQDGFLSSKWNELVPVDLSPDRSNSQPAQEPAPMRARGIRYGCYGNDRYGSCG